jgi:hypothetical protein
VSLVHFDKISSSYPNKCWSGILFASATCFVIGDTHTLGTCWEFVSRRLPQLPKDWLKHKMLLCMQHCVEISKETLFQ